LPTFGLLNPTLSELLQKFKLDKEYTGADGVFLYDCQGNTYLDFISQYGSVPFGYNPPEILNAVREFLDSRLPAMVQPSVPIKAVELAESLIKLAPCAMAQATFCQSGAEAVEAAIKLARSTMGKAGIISATNSFHGKTMGALSATGRDVYQKPFFSPAPGFMTIPFDDLDALEDVLKSASQEIAAFIVEPVQGEGGIIIPSDGYLKQAEILCRKHNVLFIVDEIQTGLGRTGYLFACEREGVEPDILLLSKALGGGLVPIGVCLSSKKAWNDDFGRLHSSTFANNNFTCSIGLAVLDKLTENNRAIIDNAAKRGQDLLYGLKEIAGRFPGVIREVRGIGLMAGVEFNGFDGSESFSIKFLAEQGGFSALLAGYLLHNHRVRCAPFLNNPMTLRLQPSLNITRKEIDMALTAVSKTVEILYYRDYSELYSYLVDRKSSEVIIDFRNKQKPVIGSKLGPGEKPTEKFAFLIHYPATEDVAKNNPSFSRFSQKEMGKILDWEASLNSPPVVIVHLPALKSKAGKIAEGWLIGIPYSGKHLMEMPRQRAIAVLAEAVELAKDLGAGILGLGAYTSVVSRGGTDLQGRGIAITSGNSFTVATAFDALLEGAAMMEIDPGRAVGSVIGATGAIGRVCAIMLAEEVEQLFLVGNPEKEKTSLRRLERLSDEIYKHAMHIILTNRNNLKSLKGISRWLFSFFNRLEDLTPGTWKKVQSEIENTSFSMTSFINNSLAKHGQYSSPPVKITVNIRQALLVSDLVISASSSVSSLIWPEYLKPGCVICDVARPADVSRAVLNNRKDVLVIEGGLVRYPDKICFGQNIGYEPGMNLACLSETMLLALESDYRDFSIGIKIPLQDIYYLRDLAAKHGFELAMPQNEQQKITPKVAAAARKAASSRNVRLKKA